MKNLKLMLAVLCFIAIPNAIRAQVSQEQKAEMIAQFQENKERLKLTPEQEEPFKTISKKYAQEMKAAKTGSDDRREKFKKMKDIRDRKNTEMRGLLSESQYKTYLEIQDERIQKIKQRSKP